MCVFPQFRGTFRDEAGPRETASLGLITRRSQVQILPPLLRKGPSGPFRFSWVPHGCHSSPPRQHAPRCPRKPPACRPGHPGRVGSGSWCMLETRLRGTSDGSSATRTLSDGRRHSMRRTASGEAASKVRTLAGSSGRIDVCPCSARIDRRSTHTLQDGSTRCFGENWAEKLATVAAAALGLPAATIDRMGDTRCCS